MENCTGRGGVAASGVQVIDAIFTAPVFGAGADLSSGEMRPRCRHRHVLDNVVGSAGRQQTGRSGDLQKGAHRMDWGKVFAAGLSYRDFLAKHATPDQQKRWQAVYDSVTLTGDQRELLGGFVREMRVLCIAGAWCGDCVNQCPILARIAEQNPRIAVRFVDRDVQAAAQEAAMMNGGRRVPAVIFLSED